MKKTLVPHEGRLRLFEYDSTSFLWDAVSGISYHLSERFERLHFHDGQGVLIKDGASHWAHERCLSTSATWMLDSTDQKARVKVVRSSTSQTFDLECVLHSHAWDGAYMHWDLPKLWESMGANEETVFAETRKKAWDQWCKYIAESLFRWFTFSVHGDAPLFLACPQLELPPTSLLHDGRPACTTTLPEGVGCYPRACASTTGLLALLARWSSRDVHTGKVHASARCLNLLSAFIEMLPPQFHLQLYLSEAVLVPPYCVTGSNAITLLVQKGVVNICLFRQQHPQAFAQYFLDLDSDNVSLVDLLLATSALARGRNVELGLLPQMILHLAWRLELTLCKLLPHQRHLHPWWKNAACKLVGPESYDEIKHHLRSYSAAVESKIKDVDVLCVAVDDSRVGRQHWKLLCVQVPGENFAAWLPPQAT
eukprot:6465496-Amphidinium_carterae.1